jgi:multiple sugar transport system substrate-binding protein
MLAGKNRSGSGIMRVRTILLAAVLVLAPLGLRAADLVVWWEQGYNPEEDTAIKETVAAFERKADKRVEVLLHEQSEMPDELQAALQAGRPPDIAAGSLLNAYATDLASKGWLVDLTTMVASLSATFDADTLERWTRPGPQTGRRALYGLPIARSGNHIHVWKSLLETAGFTLNDIPSEWERFWAFWCDEVQPAVRQALGRDDVWAVGLPMSVEATDTEDQFFQFVQAADANYVTREGRLLIDEPEVRRRLVRAMESYTAIWRKGCTPPDATAWQNPGNNRAFVTQRVTMTPNITLSIPNAIRRERPDDYYKNTATIAWPLGPGGNPFPIYGEVRGAVVFANADHVAAAEDFLRFLVEEGWLAHWLDFAGDRLLPTIPALRRLPFWLDPSDPHRMAAAIQVESRPLVFDYSHIDQRYGRVYTEHVWAKSVHRVAADDLGAEQAVDEAIARVKQLLSE